MVEGLDEGQRLKGCMAVGESTVAAEPVLEALNEIFFLVWIL